MAEPIVDIMKFLHKYRLMALTIELAGNGKLQS